ncbi:MAG: cysteine synthase family protein [Prolixibacteraceae bacterium]|nr:cysteine synthase family protein [Prolixibacteraceae bacterium]
MLKKSIIELIGNTPLVKLNKLKGRNCSIYCKQEYIQPGGSVKDRAALYIIRDAYSSGKLSPGQLVVEMTSGNMGSGLAVVCRYFGNPFTAVMPSGNSSERVKILRALGAEVVLTEQVDGKTGMVTGRDIEYASETAAWIASENNGYYVDQFNNISGINAHFETTGPEILYDLPETNAFITSIGTGGTFTGIARFLKMQNSNIRCIAVEPERAAILKNGFVENPQHIIQGTGYGLVPPHWEEGLADEIISVSDEEVMAVTKRLSSDEGLFAGYSSGANVAAALKYAESHSNIKNIVTILCDTGYKYSGI